MDFNDTPEEAAFRAEAVAWLEANAERRQPGDTDNPLNEATTPEMVAEAKAWQKKKADAGWACITWPKEYGGRGATPMQNVIWNEEQAKFRTPRDIYGIGIGMCGPTILAHGTPEQRKRWIPKLISGEEVWCQLFSEPSAGSDLAGLRSTAVRQGDDWIVNGQKIWTTGAQFCDWGVLVVRTDPTVAKHAGLTYFVVDMHAPGVEIRPITQINQGRGFNEVFFTDVRIPDDQRISESIEPRSSEPHTNHLVAADRGTAEWHRLRRRVLQGSAETASHEQAHARQQGPTAQAHAVGVG